MRIHNDQTLLSLAEDFCQMHGRQHTAAQHIAEGKSRPHRRQLIRVTHQDHPLALGDRLHQTVQQLDVYHGHLVDDHHIRFQRIFLIPGKYHPARSGIDPRFQQPVNGGGILPGHFRQPLGCTARGRRQQAFQLHLSQKFQNTV